MSATASLPRSIEFISPFRHSSESRAEIPAKISGEIPSWLRGEVFRTCPVVFESREWRARHWFDGLGMIYAFRIGSSGVGFQSRLLDSETARDASRGESNLGTFGTPTTRPLLRRVLEPVPRVSDNTNVNIARMGSELVAMTEGNRQLSIDETTLASLGAVAYAKDAVGSGIMTAHPHFDVARGKVVNVATGFGAGGVISVYEHAPEARRREVVGSWRTSRVPYVHSFGLTPRHGILVAHPFLVTPLNMLWSSKGYIDHFAWQPEEGTRFVLMNREKGSTREHVGDALFVFHTVNAFEDDGATILDLLAYPDADIVAALRVDRMLTQLPDLRPSLVRVILRAGVERASMEKLTDVGFEFPSTNYRLVSGRPYRFVWGACDSPRASGEYSSAIIKVDLQTGRATSFGDDAHVFGEPLFVARPEGTTEDDGVLLTVGSAQDAETSVLAVIDAQTMALIASAEVMRSIPLGFHGSFARRAG